MNAQRVAAVGSIVAVVAAVVAALWLLGSPGEQRLLRLDERRVADLRQLALTITARWNERHVLPGGVAELVDGRYLSVVPVDPSRRVPYEYRATAERRFELCATFDRAARARDASDFWYHDAGHRCFAFDVTERTRYAE